MFDAVVNVYQKAVYIGFGEESKRSMLKVYEKNFDATASESVDKINKPSI